MFIKVYRYSEMDTKKTIALKEETMVHLHYLEVRVSICTQDAFHRLSKELTISRPFVREKAVKGIIFYIFFSICLVGCVIVPLPQSEPTNSKVTEMNWDKVDQRLLEEIRIRREQSDTETKNLQELTEAPFEISIELVQPVTVPKGVSRQQALEQIEQQVEQSQADLVEHLDTFNVTEFDRQLLSNSIVATLTLDQIGEITQRNDVKMIRLVKVEKVVP